MSTSGAVIATQTSLYEHFIEIPLPPGSYTIAGTFLGATICGGPTITCGHPTETESVTIRAGYTTRQDFFLDIP